MRIAHQGKLKIEEPTKQLSAQTHQVLILEREKRQEKKIKFPKQFTFRVYKKGKTKEKKFFFFRLYLLSVKLCTKVRKKPESERWVVTMHNQV